MIGFFLYFSYLWYNDSLNTEQNSVSRISNATEIIYFYFVKMIINK